MAAKKIELDDKLIVQQYKDGLPSSKIAEINYVSIRTVYRVLNEHCAISKPKISKESLIHCYCEKKMTIESIAKKHRTSKYSIRLALKKYQIKKSRARKIMNEQLNNELLLKAMMAADQISAIKIYCEERSKFDDQLEKALKNPDKTYEDCWDYIMEKTKKHLNSKSGHVMPNIAFGWAVHYFTEPNDVIEEEIGKIKKSKQPIENTKNEKEVKKPKKSESSVETKSAFERMSIFDFMENEDNDENGDDVDTEEEVDE